MIDEALVEAARAINARSPEDEILEAAREILRRRRNPEGKRPGAPIKPERCACGKYTAATAAKRNHQCQA